MMQRMIGFALVATLSGHFAASACAQGGALRDRAAAAAQAQAQAQAQQRAQAQIQQRAQAQVQQRAQAQVQQRAQAQIQQRAQTQVQQRAQAQVQQRAQAQVQQRVQGQIQQRVQGQLGSRLRGAGQRSAAAAGRMRQPQGQAQRLDVTAGTRVQADGSAAGTEFSADSKIRVNGSGRLVVPGPALLGNGEVNVKYFDNVFGRFNPFRQAEGQSSAEAPSSATESSAPSQQRIAGNGSQKRALDAQVDLSKAVRLRSSEISAIRDHALATGNTQLMASADQMEEILNRFVEAQAAAEAQARTAVRGAPNAQGLLQAGLNASATGQAQGRIGSDAPRVALLPEAGSTIESESSSTASAASGAGTAQ